MELEKQFRLRLDFKEIPMSEAPYTRTLRQALVDDFVPTMQWMRQAAFPKGEGIITCSLPAALEWSADNTKILDEGAREDCPAFVQPHFITASMFMVMNNEDLDNKIDVAYAPDSFAWINEMFPFMLSTFAVHADLALGEYRQLVSGEMDERLMARYLNLGKGESGTDYKILLGEYIESGAKDAEQVLADFWCGNLYLHYRASLERKFGSLKDLQSK